ncbi:MAG TPA: hypothetical protein DCZ94_14730 [Lentisphaeria bacterium]|nr:MAG: hypothetical protein A2X48_02885 [Lentisphaerae bacterium GWF2_49_21]HBC88203.1 hypothetical protein [Lentisphaeria bacterium]
MSIKRIVAIGFIYLLGCAGWIILGTSTMIRSDGFSSRLGYAVEALWGSRLVQEAPSLSVQIPGSSSSRWIMPEENDIKVSLKLDYRKKGLVWYPTFVSTFTGKYKIHNIEGTSQKVRMHFNFPAKGGTYDEFSFAVDGAGVKTPVNTEEGINEIIELAPGATKEFKLAYKTRGIYEWRYRLDKNTGRVQHLAMSVKTDFKNIDYPDGTLSAMTAKESADGMTLEWKAEDLITNQEIGVIIPEKLNPGPVASRITYFAPVCLLFFFILVATIGILKNISIHPMHYLFVTAGFFAFHLLLAYMVDHITIHMSFAISAVVSVLLVTSYLSMSLGRNFPWKLAALGQIFFLVVFSYSFFFKGMTGLTVAICSVITLAILMYVTAKTNWTEVFSKPVKKKVDVVEQNEATA